MGPTDAVIEVNEVVTITADWSTNRDINCMQWYINGIPQGVVEGSAKSGSVSFVFSSLEEGVYELRFRIWHHIQSDRDATKSVIVTVINSGDGDDYPAAPAVAHKLLKQAGVKNKYDGGNYIADVTAEMRLDGTFRGVKKSDVGDYENVVSLLDYLSHPIKVPVDLWISLAYICRSSDEIPTASTGTATAAAAGSV